jgi:hypothetical protein
MVAEIQYKELECTRNKKWWGLTDKEVILTMCLSLGLDGVEYAELAELVSALQRSDKKENQQQYIKKRKALRDADKHGDKQLKCMDGHCTVTCSAPSQECERLRNKTSILYSMRIVLLLLRRLCAVE